MDEPDESIRNGVYDCHAPANFRKAWLWKRSMYLAQQDPVNHAALAVTKRRIELLEEAMKDYAPDSCWK